MVVVAGQVDDGELCVCNCNTTTLPMRVPGSDITQNIPGKILFRGVGLVLGVLLQHFLRSQGGTCLLHNWSFFRSGFLFPVSLRQGCKAKIYSKEEPQPMRCKHFSGKSLFLSLENKTVLHMFEKMKQYVAKQILTPRGGFKHFGH